MAASGWKTLRRLGRVAVTLALVQIASVATAHAQSLLIEWNANPEPDILRYLVYVHTAPFNEPAPVAPILVDAPTCQAGECSHTFGVVPGTRYYVRLKAVNQTLQESVFSDQADGKVNAIPVFDPPGNRTDTIDQALNFSFTATDADSNPVDTLTWSALNLPTGLSINAGGLVTGSPTVPGIFNTTVSVSDGTAPPVQRSFTWTITSGPLTVDSLTPDLASPQAPGKPITFTALASGGVPPRSYKFRVNGVTVRDWAASNSFAWTAGPTGDHSINVWVRNAGNNVDAPDAQLTIIFTTNAALDPTMPALSVTSHAENQAVGSFNITLSGTASDFGFGGTGIVSVTVNGVAATGGTAAGDATANWSRTFTLGQVGGNVITVVATDGAGNARTVLRTVTLATITLSETSVNPGSVVQATITGGPGNATDWVGLASTSDSNWINWKYLNGAQAPPANGLTGATVAFTMPPAPGTYNVRFQLNNTNTSLAVSATITVTPVTVTLSATTVSPGTVISATIANGPANATDWAALASTSDSIWIDWKYLNGSRTPPVAGAAGAALAFTAPSTPGTYNVRFFPNNTNTPLITSAILTVTPLTIALSSTSVNPGAVVTATITNGPGNATDWVGLASTSNSNWIDWKYLNGAQSPPANGVTGATLNFTMPSAPGTYNLRFFPNNTNAPLITSATITVTPVTITLSSTSASPGEVVTATIANGPANATDWVGFASTSDSNWIDWKYLNGSQTPPVNGVAGASVNFTMPSTPGTYNVRFLPSNSNTPLMTSATITVGATIMLSATTVNPGAVVTATIANGHGNATDWVGLASAGDSTWIDWKYLNGSQSPPANGVTGATLAFTMPSAPGTYNLRFFPNNGNTPFRTSATITVTPLTIALSATRVSPGAVVTATIANGPANATDWLGLASTSDSIWLDWKYLNGSQTPPVNGTSDAVVNFTMPMTPGTYNIRFFPNNSNTSLMTSATIIVGGAIALSATNVNPGAVVTATISEGPGNATDWVALASTGNSIWLDWKYLNGLQSPPANGVTGAVLNFTMPSNPGTYNVRFFPNNSNTPLSTSATITVTPVTLELSATTVAPGAVVTVTVANGPANATDWLGLASTSDSIWIDWKYLNGSRTPPANGVAGAAVNFTMPMMPGTYNIRFFPNNTNSVLMTSAAITVQ